jgi:hypothetical protein
VLQPVATVRPRGAGGKPAARNSSEVRLRASGPMAFSGKDAVVATNLGLLRCADSGICQAMKGFGRGEGIRAIWVSAAGDEIGVVMDGKFGWSLDGGASATWRDLPVAAEHVVWIDAAVAKKTAYLGTDKGVFFSTDGNAWQLIGGGLPSGYITAWLSSGGIWAAGERDGGFYISRDSGGSWRRVDGDGERGQFTGIVEMPGGGLLAGSRSEGLLALR